MEERNKTEELIADAVEEEPNGNVRKVCRKRVFLFNCDNTYSLDSVEKLLLDVKGDIRRELSFDIVKTYFRLSQMSDMCEKTIPKLHMDVAIFVVHANESRLSINEENAGIGYAKVYKALLQATDGRVIVVIGGDDYYKNEDEEESSVISRWAWRKISSQFKEEFLDGRESFVFSWNARHRTIHEEALMHYFDSSRRGHKFKCKRSDRSKSPEVGNQRALETKKTAAAEEKQLTHSSPEKGANRWPPFLGETGESKTGKRKKESKTQNKDTGYKEHKNILEGCSESSSNKTVKTNTPEMLLVPGGMGERQVTMDVDASTTDKIGAVTSSDDDFVMVDKDDIGFSEEQQINRNATLVLKTRMRNGCISFEDNEMKKLDKQWIPPGGLLPLISEQWANVAEADVEIYHVKETGADRVIIKELSNYWGIYAIIDYFYNMVTGMIDSVLSFITQQNKPDCQNLSTV